MAFTAAQLAGVIEESEDPVKLTRRPLTASLRSLQSAEETMLSEGGALIARLAFT